MATNSDMGERSAQPAISRAPIGLASVDDATTLEIEKRPLKKYNDIIYLRCSTDFTVEPLTPTLFPCKNRNFESCRLAFSSRDNEAIVEKLRILRRKFAEAIRLRDPKVIRDIKIIEVDEDDNSGALRPITFTIPKGRPTECIDTEGNYINLDRSKLNRLVPRGSSLLLVMTPCATYNTISHEVQIFFQTSAIKLRSAPTTATMSDNARALLNM